MWILIGLVAGTVGGGLRPDARRRSMTDAAALGYRVGLGDNPVTMRMRQVVGDGDTMSKNPSSAPNRPRLDHRLDRLADNEDRHERNAASD